MIKINDIVIKQNRIHRLPANPHLRDKAKENRKKGVLSEVLLWQHVSKRQFHGIDFDRQKVIGNYIVDFFVKDLGLVVEIDGVSHDFQFEYDQKRDEFLKSLGLKVIHLKDIDVKTNLDGVLKFLEEFIVAEYGVF